MLVLPSASMVVVSEPSPSDCACKDEPSLRNAGAKNSVGSVPFLARIGESLTSCYRKKCLLNRRWQIRKMANDGVWRLGSDYLCRFLRAADCYQDCAETYVFVWHQLNRYSHALHNLADNLLRLLRLLQGRRIASVDHHPVAEHRHRQLLEIFGRGKAAAVEISHRLRCAIQHLRAARRDPKRKIIGVAGSADGKRGGME